MTDPITDAVRGECNKTMSDTACLFPACGCRSAARHAHNAAIEAAANIERDVYFRLIGTEAMPCACGNGRIPTTSFRDATQAYAAAIRTLKIGDKT